MTIAPDAICLVCRHRRDQHTEDGYSYTTRAGELGRHIHEFVAVPSLFEPLRPALEVIVAARDLADSATLIPASGDPDDWERAPAPAYYYVDADVMERLKQALEEARKES